MKNRSLTKLTESYETVITSSLSNQKEARSPKAAGHIQELPLNLMNTPAVIFKMEGNDGVISGSEGVPSLSDADGVWQDFDKKPFKEILPGVYIHGLSRGPDSYHAPNARVGDNFDETVELIYTPKSKYWNAAMLAHITGVDEKAASSLGLAQVYRALGWKL